MHEVAVRLRDRVSSRNHPDSAAGRGVADPRAPYVRAGPVWSLNPSEIADLVIFEMNTSHMAVDDSEALAVSFVPTATGSPGRFTIAPVIAQTSSRAIVCDQSYFFRDFSGVV